MKDQQNFFTYHRMELASAPKADYPHHVKENYPFYTSLFVTLMKSVAQLDKLDYEDAWSIAHLVSFMCGDGNQK